jgi:membrane fusion protein (multidrug efflux system)
MLLQSSLIPVSILAMAGALFFTINASWTRWEGNKADQRTDDAYVRVDVTPMSTRISGTVKKVDVEDYRTVSAGQALIELDDSDYRAVLAQSQTALAGSEEAMAATDAARAGIAAVEPEVTRSELERGRQHALLEARAATHQQKEAADAEAARFNGTLASRQADLKRAEAALSSSRALLDAERSQRLALDTQDALYQADIQEKRAGIVVARVNLDYTKIIAPVSGTVGERHVHGEDSEVSESIGPSGTPQDSAG